MGYARDDYYPAFDWLQIVLALVVASRHAGLIGLDHAGKMAVDVFFALSGWLIGGILLRSRLADLPRFYFNRATRIWIPYALAIALLSLASVLIEVGIRHVHLTSKWYEMTFYDVTFVYNWFWSAPTRYVCSADAVAGHGKSLLEHLRRGTVLISWRRW